MARSLFPHVSPSFNNKIEEIYINGLLHNLGIAVLVHLFPREMEEVFLQTNSGEDSSVTACTKTILGIDQHQAGGWLARRWGLPPDMVAVMEHHKELDYQQDYWPVVQTVGYCARQAGNLFHGIGAFTDSELLTSLGIPESVVAVTRQALDWQMEDIKALAAQMANGEVCNG
jgi:HD-like signal output (HDOD) protein